MRRADRLSLSIGLSSEEDHEQQFGLFEHKEYEGPQRSINLRLCILCYLGVQIWFGIAGEGAEHAERIGEDFFAIVPRA